jgi:hypothetical protein
LYGLNRTEGSNPSLSAIFSSREIRGFEREHAADEQEEKRDARERERRANRREGAGLDGRSLIGRIPPSPPFSLKPVFREDCPYGEVSELAEGTRLEIA